MSDTCTWTLQDDDWTVWDTACGESWFLSNDDTPTENGMRFCPFCGRPLVVAGLRAEGRESDGLLGVSRRIKHADK